MDRREMMGALVVGTAGLLTTGRDVSAMLASQTDDAAMKVAMDACLKACKACASTCEETFHHCFGLVTEGKKEHARAAELALDCADFCALSVKMMLRQSDLMAASCHACAMACKQCGDECARFDSTMMKQCVAACRACEQTCRAMAEAMPAGHHHPA